MTVIRPNSISGINSITANGGDINLFRADGTKADIPIVNNISAGVVTATTLNATSGTITGNLGVGGVLTYEDVTNIDSVGVITARTDINIGDSIIHIGDTNTKIRFPADDTISFETAGGERLRIDSGGSVSIGDAATHTYSAHSEGDDLVIGGAGWRGMTIYGEGGGGVIQFADAAGNRDGQIMYDHGNRQFMFRTAGNVDRLLITSEGYVKKPIQPAFHAYGASSWTQFTGSSNVLKLLNTECNIGSHYKTSGSDEGKFVCPVAGTYFFYLTIYSGRTDNSQTDNSDYLAINLVSSTGNLANKGGHHIAHYYNEADRDSTRTMSYIKTCAVGEKIYIQLNCNGTGFQVYGGHSGFGGYLIG